jgi:RNAse (barnase) inhibitor barstar
VAPFRLDHGNELPWLLMQNGPVTMYARRDDLDAAVIELRTFQFVVCRFDCATWADDAHMHRELRDGLGLPDYTGANFDALSDSLTDMDVPDIGGVAIVLDEFDGRAGATRRCSTCWPIPRANGSCSAVCSRCSCTPTTTAIARRPTSPRPARSGATRAGWTPRAGCDGGGPVS